MNVIARLKHRLHLLDNRSWRLLLTAGTGYLGRFGAGIALLVTIPMARAALPAELFGVWMMLSSLVGFLAFADLGVGNGVLNRVTRALASRNDDDVHRTIVAGYQCTGAVGVALVAAWAAWLAWSDEPMRVVGRIPGAFDHDARTALTLFVVLLAINIPASLVQKVQLGAQQGQWIGLVQFITALGTLVALPATLYLGGSSLAALVAASLGVQVAVNVINSILWLRLCGMASGLSVVARSDRALIGELLRSGSLFFMLQVAMAFAFQSDAIVITQVLGQRVYGDFAVAQKLFLFISMIVASATAGLWPAFGDAIARRDVAWARRALWRGLAVAGAFAALASLLLIVSIGWITRHWLHVRVPPALALTLLLGAWTVVDAMGAIGGAFMNGANALRTQAAVAIVMAAAAFGGKWWFTPIWGPAGAVAATLIAYLMICVPGQVFIFRRLFREIRA